MINFLSIRLTNERPHRVSLVVEPWGEIYSMDARETFEVRFEIAGEEPAQLPEIVWEKDQILVYAGVGGDIELYHDGLNLRTQNSNGTKANLEKLVA